MKKLFLLIPALVLSLAINAKEINITPTSPHSSGNNLLATLADAGTEDGDVIILADGTYNESSNYISFDKSVEVRAAEGAHPVVEVETYIKIGENAANKNITIRGIKFDAEKQGPTGTTANTYSHFIRVYSAGTLDFEDCEFCNTQANKVIKVEADKHLNYLKINNCYFHDGNNSAIHVYQATDTHACDRIEITNSTFANYSGFSDGLVEVFTKGGALAADPADDAEFTMDHCTFYNYIKTADNTYGFVDVRKSTKTTISNCIFMNPTIPDGSYNAYATYTYGGSVTNCIYNGTRGNRMSPTGSSDADPLFNDLANNKYTFAGDWTTMTISPARGAATDGSDLGAPRWYSAETLPESNFVAPYAFLGEKAVVSNNMELDANNYIHSISAGGSAIWKIHATRACNVQVTLNMDPDGLVIGHNYQVEVFDVDGNSIGSLDEGAWSNNVDDKVLSGSISFPAEGDYKIVLTNSISGTESTIKGITLSYVGGAVQAMPGTTDINDAWFSANGTRADGKISFPGSTIQDGWVKWNVSFASAANYNVTVNIENANGHNYTVALYRSESDPSPIILSEGAQKSTIGTLELGAMEVPAGNYILKVTNAIQWSDAKLISVNFAYAGGAAVELSKTTPASLLANADAILSNDWTIEAGQISYSESKATTGWAKWNVNCADYGNYTMTVNISSDNGHGMRVEVFEDEAQPAIYTLDEPSAGKYHTGDLALDLGNILLADREYVVKITNTVSSSHAKITSIVITYLNGSQATLPATFNFEDGMLSEKAHITADELWFNTIGDSNPVGQWAKWNVKVTDAGTYLFTMNVSSTNGQSYKISILDGETEIDAFESGSVGSGDQTVKHYFNLAAGNYTVKLENTYPWSQGHIVSLAVTQPSLLVLNEAAETNTVISDNYRNGAHDIQIIRTIVPGMYNTICLPFDVNSTQLQAIFGSDVELKQMASTTLNGSELDLNFDAVTSIYRGTPYLIKTSKTVTNPVFAEVEIKEETGQATSTDIVDFIGSFIKSEVPAGEDNLFLGQNDMLYFSSTATPIKGMRAWFKVKVSNPQHVIQHARIVTGGQVVTSIDLVNGDIVNETVKAIENGQLVIIRDGVRYNAMGIRLQ